MSFSDLGLLPELARAVADKGYETPTPIQAQAIPAVLEGRDVMASAQTGTGKTAAFVLPILQSLQAGSGRTPRALVLTPTRELAAQIAESAYTYGKHLRLRTVVVFGGVGINPQIDALRNGCDLLIATPGRLLDLADQRAVNLSQVKCFVLDEADRMLDMGFIRPIRQVIALLPRERQNLLFSATYSEDIRNLAHGLLRSPLTIDVAPRNATAERVDQQVYRVSKEHKRHLLAHLILSGGWDQVLVFTRTKHGANRLTQQLEGAGIRAAAIHGNKSQGARVRALDDFKARRITALVATEVAARGLDIKELPQVVNYELPNVPEDYVHRIGRTARAGGSGCAVSLVSPDEAPLLKDIERLLRRTLPVTATPQYEVKVVSTPVPQRAPPPPSRPSSAPRRHGQGQQPRRERHSGGGHSGQGGHGAVRQDSRGVVSRQTGTDDRGGRPGGGHGPGGRQRRRGGGGGSRSGRPARAY